MLVFFKIKIASTPIPADNAKATVVRCSTPKWSATMPIRKLMSILPIKAMVSTILNAVPDTSAKRLPTKPSITGNPAANPAPIIISPATATTYCSATLSKIQPVSRITNETSRIWRAGRALNTLPRSKRIAAIPATYSDKAKSA